MRPKLGPNVTAVARLPIKGRKRAKVLLAIAAFADEGRDDPSIGELAERTGLHRAHVVALVDRLEVDRHLSVNWGDTFASRRNRYRVGPPR